MNISGMLISGCRLSMLRQLQTVPSANFIAGFSMFPKERRKKEKIQAQEPETQPKKPPGSAWTLFVSKSYPVIKSKHPDLTNVEAMKKMSVDWKSLSESKKSEWQKLLLKEKEKYKKYVEKLPAEAVAELTGTASRRKMSSVNKEKSLRNDLADLEKRSGKPSRPGNAYILFSRKRRENSTGLENLSAKETITIISEEWNKLGQVEKDKFTKQAEDLQVEFRKSLDDWDRRIEMSGQKQELLAIKEKLAALKKENAMKEVETKLKDLLSKLEKPALPKTAYALFCSEEKLAPGGEGLKPSDLKLRWKELDEERKHIFLANAASLKNAHSEEMAAWSQKIESSGQLEEIHQLQIKISDMKRKAASN